MDLTDIKPTIIDSEESLNIIAKPRSFTFDNPAMVRILYEYSWFYYMSLSMQLSTFGQVVIFYYHDRVGFL